MRPSLLHSLARSLAGEGVGAERTRQHSPACIGDRAWSLPGQRGRSQEQVPRRENGVVAGQAREDKGTRASQLGRGPAPGQGFLIARPPAPLGRTKGAHTLGVTSTGFFLSTAWLEAHGSSYRGRDSQRPGRGDAASLLRKSGQSPNTRI